MAIHFFAQARCNFLIQQRELLAKPRIDIRPRGLIASIAKGLIQKHPRACSAFDLFELPDCANQCIPGTRLFDDGLPNWNRRVSPEPHVNTGAIVPQTKTKLEANMPLVPTAAVRSLATDRRSKAKTIVKKGESDRGDQARR